MIKNTDNNFDLTNQLIDQWERLSADAKQAGFIIFRDAEDQSFILSQGLGSNRVELKTLTEIEVFLQGYSYRKFYREPNM